MKFQIIHYMEGKPESKHGKYRIPKPDKSGDFIYSNDVAALFRLFVEEFYKPNINSPSLRGKIQYITNNF